MGESEPFMNYNCENWYIPREFHNLNPETKLRMENTLSKIGKNIKCPLSFNGSEINQTKLFRHKFLDGVVNDRAIQSNPDEIEIDI